MTQSMSEDETLSVRIARSFAEIDTHQWDALVTAVDDTDTDPDNPFVRSAFLSALERSGSATAGTGWQGAHLLVETGDGTLLAAAPAYLKSHSMGEYVFDQNWANAYERAGGRYYPKLQIAVPFTPATGPRLLADATKVEARRNLIITLPIICERLGASSVHLTFLPEAEAKALTEAGFLHRTDQQFHWFNEDYADFEAFLGALSSRKRKLIRRERRDALRNGITIERLTGAAITPEHWDAFFAFYMDTGSRKWGRPYLTRAFFTAIGETMADRILLVMAKREGRYIAGAINFIGSRTLYGRNWGCIEDHPFLHFEVCYYQAIDFAIELGFTRVEAGAQGEHKLARGYRPVTTHSAHYIADPSLRRAVAAYLADERAYVAELHDDLAGKAPFRHQDHEDGE